LWQLWRSNLDSRYVCLKIEGTESVYGIKTIIMHENYGQDDAGYDIALLELSRDLQYSDAVLPVCLPDGPPPDYANSVAIGWGETQGMAAGKHTVWTV